MDAAVRKGKYKYLVLVLLYLGWCVSYIDRAAITFAATQIASEFHLKPSDLGILLSSFFLGYSLLQLPGGWLADRYGSRPVIVISILLWSLFTGVTGMAWSVTSLVMIRFIFGVGEGAFPAASVKGVAENFSRDERPKMSSLLMSSNYIGSMLAPLLIAPLILHYGWRAVFHYIGIAGVVFALVYWFCVRPVRPGVGGAGAINKQAFMALMKMPLMWQIVAVWFGLSIINKGLDTWMPTYLMTVRGLNLKAVGLLLPLPYIMAGLSTAIGGWVMVRFFDGREKLLLIGSSLLTAVFVYCMYSAASVEGVIAWQCLAYFFKSFVLATCIALPTKMLQAQLVGSGVGMVNLGGQLAGFISPLVIGFLVSAFANYDYAFSFLIGAAFFSVLVSLFIRTHKSDSQMQPA
ncbi:MFS transporter [Herbaspirillum seropedicae]|uniref:Transport transmembrane protein n=1 Tax=Herbaspirillum seropedicae (strain SmR1) TaxID=757424 RepID=D8IVN4_HERSS|nr:MFS transporter [Herbaspirillum seropedicae]ADJ65842.1 transport transmembrane protein [Herbaspirillum seropedicae SmR1]AKN67640.1 MFS transporter [Herbaspirillum seropedicae]AON56730.1 transport transmembrane protein [Herbaspirillum seropedicae]MDR6397581.1 sugar phosphate permease [Herbaspirillum seropedicae]NQE29687.1 MFS transporter [Herbaspirillum seropedicae]